MKKKFIIKDMSDVEQFAQQLCGLMNQCKIFTFDGPLGVGKTTLIQKILHKCGVDQPITSPTFNYVNVHENANGQLFYHFDLYRITSLEQFLQSGFDEYLYLKDSWAFIEWPAVIKPLLTKQVCNIVLEYGQTEHERIVYFFLNV